MPYFEIVQGGVPLLWCELATILILLLVCWLFINRKCSNKRLRYLLYICLIIQICILLFDNHIGNLLLGDDSRTYEYTGWRLACGEFPETTVNYSRYVILPIYKLLRYRLPIVLGALNILLNILLNIQLYNILNLLEINRKVKITTMKILIFFPLSLILRTSILRECLIVFLLVNSFYYILLGIKFKDNKCLIKCFCFLFLGSFFHSGCIFISLGYIYILLKNNMVKSKYKICLLILIVLGVFMLKDIFLRKLANGNLETILKINNSIRLKNANTGYLRNIRTNSALDVILYLPLFMVFFLFSPMVFEIKNLTSLGVFLFNSSIYFYLVINSIVLLNKIKKYLKKSDKILIIGLILSFIATIMVFSVGTRNFGTAMRHRDKIFFILVLVYTILKDRYLKFRRKY